MPVQLTASDRPLRVAPVMFGRAARETRRIILVVTAVPLLVPIFMLVVFARVFSFMLGTSDFNGASSYVQYLAPGALLMSVMLSATSAVSVAVERQTGFYDRMRISPSGPSVSNLARRAADATKLFLFALVLVIVSWFSGAAVENWPLLLVLGTLIPAAWGFAYGGFAFAACLRSGKAEVAEAILPLSFPLLFVSSAFVPISALPAWMQPIASYNPLTYLCDSIRGAYLGQFDGRALGFALLSIVLLAGVTQALVMASERKVARTS